MTAHDIVGGVVTGQVMVLMAAMIFALFELSFVLTGQRRQFQTRRLLCFATCLSVAVLPVALPFLIATPYAATLNATDAIVGQYLKGNIAISAMEMNTLVEMRATWVSSLATGAGLLAQILLALFLTVALARCAYLVVNLHRIRRAMSRGAVLHKTRRLQIIVSPDVSVPFSTRGFRRYYVVLPESVARDAKALRICLGHEFQHIRQGDVDAEILLALASPVLVLNPGFWYVSGRLRKLGELACDRAFLMRRHCDAHSYSLKLLGIARRAKQAQLQPSAFGVPLIGRSLPWIGRKSMLKDRILEIARDLDNPTRETRWVGIVFSGALAVLVMGTATSMSKPADWSHERIMLSTVVNLERIDQLNTLAQRSW